MMNLDFSTRPNQPVNQISTQAIVVLVPSDTKKQFARECIPAEIYTQIDAALQDGDFKATPGYCLLLRCLPQLKAPRLLLVGVGLGGSKDISKAMAAAVQALRQYSVTKAVLCLSCLPQVNESLIEVAVTSAADAAYVYTHTLSDKKNTPKKLQLQLTGADQVVLKSSLVRAMGIAQGVCLAKEWGNRPPNHATPALLAGAAKFLAKPGTQITTQVMGPNAVSKLGMGAFMAVAQGSQQPLRFIVMKYQGAPASIAPIVLVGKGITFDAGGISLKPAAGMDEMKFDMCGAASVLGTFEALGRLKPKINVIGLIASCENLPDGKAIKPGDVVTSMSGQTVEILNTDAEGRLILCDALTYAKRFKPQAVIDIATLTGACVVALGKIHSGLFSNDALLQEELRVAGVQAADLCWPMPLDDEYSEALKSNFADMANVGSRDGGAITAAKFLQRFVAYPWAHLDVAGTAYNSGVRKGSTGRPVGLLVHFLLTRAVQSGKATNKVAARTKRMSK